MCFFWFLSTFLVLVNLFPRWDFFFAKWGQKAFLPVLAEFYALICTRFKAVENPPGYLAMVKDKAGSGRWIVLNIMMIIYDNCELSGEKMEHYCHFILKFYLTAAPAFNMINSYLACNSGTTDI